MTDIFKNYQNIPVDYIPDNMTRYIKTKKSSQKLVSCLVNKPYEMINIKDELIGYSWNYGDNLSLHFQLIGNFDISNNIPIYYIGDEKELPNTEQTLISAQDFIQGSTVNILIKNFRNETVLNISHAEPSTDIKLDINKDLYDKIFPGIYYVNIRILKGKDVTTIFDNDDCLLMIK